VKAVGGTLLGVAQSDSEIGIDCGSPKSSVPEAPAPATQALARASNEQSQAYQLPAYAGTAM
jgi:hypothetical protein